MTGTMLVRRLGAALALVLALWGTPVLAQNAAATDVEKLVQTLEDDKARAQLVGQLKMLLKAQQPGVAVPAEVKSPALLTAIPDKIEHSVWEALRRWGGGAFDFLSQGIGQRVIGSLISIGAALLFTQIIWRLVSGAIRRYLERTDADGNTIERSRRVRTLLPLLRLVVRVVLTAMVVLIVLSELGVNIAPLLAGAGVVGIAVGFGAQKLVQDVITGIFILIEDTISLGDVVRIGSLSGVVEGMSIRALKLRDASGNLHSIPFSSVDSITNMSKDFAFAVFDVGVAYAEDVDRVIGVLEDLGAQMRADPLWADKISEPLEILGLDRFEASSVVIKARFKTKPLQQWSVMREFNKRMKKRFDADGIEIPFPQMTLWFGDGQLAKLAPVTVGEV
ncbi:mechanosensitive ion channel family protein [Magnetospirillum sp. 64-120]|uniref:mechanosensitive ion channel family protein n=1 Tax=Magnetospirillum sp. 64-120 TaxID=1895778 RepID=UPI000AF3D732|nr:mechanosensitive ion channel family protein [Magnetospirillum sp. 64-120]